MKSKLSYLLLCMMLLMPLGLSAKNTLTKKYVNRPVREVLSDLRKETGTSVRTQKKVVSTKRKVTVSFRNATPEQVLNELFDCEYVILPGKKKGSYIVNKRVLEQQIEVLETFYRDTMEIAKVPIDQVEVDSLQAILVTYNHMKIINIEDSLLLTKERVVRLTKEGELKPEVPTRQGSTLQAYLGGAYTSLGYGLEQGKNLGGIGGELSLRYAYFFTPEWGLGLGVDFSTYQSVAKLNGLYTWEGVTDSEGERYDHNAYTHDWKEQQRNYTLAIPLTAQYQHMFNDKIGVFAAVGGFVGLPMLADNLSVYGMKGGTLEHQGYYDKWHLTLDGIHSHDFYTEEATSFNKEKQTLYLQSLSYGVKADVGALLPLTEKMDLFVGAYFNMACNDLTPTDEPQHELGWRRNDYAGDEAFKNHTFMNDYQGVVGSTEASAVRPWAVGVKVGIHFRPGKKPKPAPTEVECLVMVDTTYSSATRIDTFFVQTVDTVASLKHTLRSSVIWFAVNDYAHPRVHPADLLDRVADVLIRYPQMRVRISGHASAEGNARANQVLSERRAQTVADILVEKGVNRDQLEVTALSSSVDYHSSDTDTEQLEAATGRSQAELNRRVEIRPIFE